VALKVSVVPLRLNLFSSSPPVIRKSASPLLVANEHAAKTITVTVTDLNDEAPTDIQINDTVFINGKVVLTNDKGANFLLGTLSA
jgi:hypothetical protein